ncbi:MAG: Mth938-like domain-containing protein [Burkholderiales bacterium]|nr:Mth938-like domain-containing protein [Burkholderiales bacterium]
MKFHQSRISGQNQFTGYGTDYVSINGERHERSLIVLPDRLLPWQIASFEALSEPDFEDLAALGLEVLLLGTGPRLRFPARTVARALAQAGTGLEVMDTPAACRTYNILLAEQRRVGAAVLIG